MRLGPATLALFLLGSFSPAQDKVASPPEPKSVTVPATIDHNRVIIDAEVPRSDGSTQPVHAWIDNGDPDLYVSQRVARLMGLGVTCNGQLCSGRPNSPVVAFEIRIGGIKVFLPATKEVKVVAGDNSVVAPGMNAEINIPSSVLRQHDVLIDFPSHKFTIGAPGTIHFNGEKVKVRINADNGLIQVPSQIEKKKYNLALDLGSCISFLSGEVFDELATANPDWPHMTGAVGSANLWGLQEEPKWQLMRLDRLQYGPLFLTNVAVVDFPKDRMDYFEKRAGIPTAGLLGSQALINYRIGLDYAHSTVYFEIGRTFNFPDFDVIGLVLRPEDDGRFTILGIAGFDGKPSVQKVQAGDHLVAVNDIPVPGSTMGQVWSMLGGTPGQERKLTIERGGNQFTVVSTVQHFLGEAPDETEGKKKK